MFSTINKNIADWHEMVLAIALEDGLALLVAKWPGMQQKDPRTGSDRTTEMRPRSAEEVAKVLNIPADEVRRLDAEIIERERSVLAEMNETFQRMFAWVVLPINEAGAWWDEKHSDSLFPNGDVKLVCPNCGTVNRALYADFRGEVKLPCSNCGKDWRALIRE